MDGWVSPLLGVRFDMSGQELRMIGKEGEPFAATPEAIRQRNEAIKALKDAQERAESLKTQLKALGVEPSS
jgi:hypothetical protein